MKKILLTVLVWILPTVLWGKQLSDKQYIFQRIDVREGLSYQVNCMTVSHRTGHAWMGTKNGIGRFDGYEQKKYLNCNIDQLVEDRNNNIWALGSEGIFLYDAVNDTFYRACDLNGNLISASSICLWDDGVFFGGFDKLYKYDYKTGKIALFRSITSNIKFQITDLYRFDSHTLLAANRWVGALLIDIRTGHTRDVPFDCRDVVTMLPDSKGNFWVTPYCKGVQCYNKNGKLLHTYHTGNSSMQSNIVLALAEYDGHIWIGTDGKGIAVLNPENNQMDVLTHIPGDAYSLPSNSILSFYADPENGIWAGSVRSGMFNIKEVGIKLYADALLNADYGLSEKSVLSLYQEQNEKDIWIGTDGGGLNVFNADTNKFRHIPSTYGEKVASITGVDKNHLLISLFGKGIFFYNKQTEHCTPLVIVNDDINNRLCQQGKTVNLMQNTPETILLLSESPYSYNWKRKTFTPIHINHLKDAIVGQLLPICVKETFSYLHDSKCIYRIDHNDNTLHVLYHCKQDTMIHSASADEKGIIWIGGNYGLGSFSPNDGSYTHISNSLINEAMSVASDQHGRLWIGNNERLLSWMTTQKRFILYGVPDGVAPNEYLPKPRLLSSEGDVYLGSVNGLLRIASTLPKEHPESPVLELSDVFVGGDRMEYISGRKPVLKIPEQSRTITIKVKAHNKDIFRKPAYCYNLQGYEKEPIYSYLPELTLNTLSAGTYQITASCTTRSGEWTDNYPIIELIILPPWYRTWWFILTCILTALSAVGLSVYSFLRRKENRMKLAMKEHEQQAYEEKIRFLININHELRTPLTLIHAPLKQLIEQFPAKDARYRVLQNIARQSERMKNLLNMVLDVRKMEVSQSTLHIESINLEKWLEEVVEDFIPEATQKHITLTRQLSAGIESFYCDKEKCTTIITNLLINAIKYSNEGGEINIITSLSEKKDRVRISVSDQGPGLKDIDVSKLFTRFYQGENSRPGSGIGLSYSKILAEQQGGSVGALNNVESAGSTFWFELPLNIKPGKLILQPQPYLNELLASAENIESVPDEPTFRSETKDYTILVVDDNMELVDYLTDAMRPYFKDVRTAYNGEEALEMCRQWHPDVIISDIQMPKMNGYELCKRVKEELDISHTPVILLTARNDEASRIFGYKNGADTYLTKPFEISMLYTAIYNQLKNRERIKKKYISSKTAPTPEESTFSAADEKFWNTMNQIITENIDEPNMGVPFLCDKLGMSRASLYNKLKALTGMGANDYINKLRIDNAINLLLNSSLTVNEIADRVGFSTPRYFSAVFKKNMGCSPTQYKEEQFKNNVQNI